MNYSYFSFAVAKLHQKLINTKHFARKITKTLTFCHLIDLYQVRMRIDTKNMCAKTVPRTYLFYI